MTPPCVVAERSPSLVLLLRHAEHSVVPVCGPEPLDGCPDEPVPAAEGQDQLRSDAVPWEQIASDASDAALPDGAEDAAHLLLSLLVAADAGIWADLAPDDPALVAQIQPGCQLERLGQVVLDAVAALCTQDADQSAARSSAAQAVAVLAARTGWRDAECSEPKVPTAHWRL